MCSKNSSLTHASKLKKQTLLNKVPRRSMLLDVQRHGENKYPMWSSNSYRFCNFSRGILTYNKHLIGHSQIPAVYKWLWECFCQPTHGAHGISASR